MMEERPPPDGSARGAAAGGDPLGPQATPKARRPCTKATVST